ncbi:Hypothetical protein DEACI_2481 [Acididesulfobacillus acetoxydans]|uniref:Uncharacterized protein n=1 Tax=Acididesulfobacillus acetoxydans TaxID=1561005 RepID=A0ABM9REP4_9FIRM|nr:Hypothetical protein DEACI_2481 [Acididesulfobacillus acetoxydans]
MIRKLKQFIKRLDGKVPVYNGLTRFKQESVSAPAQLGYRSDRSTNRVFSTCIDTPNML